MPPLLKEWFPAATYPLIISAPMLFTANEKLATEVTKAGGLGFLAGGLDFSAESAVLKTLDKQFTSARRLLDLEGAPEKSLPIGVGFITFHPTASQFNSVVIPLLKKHRPAAVWLFAPQPGAATHREIIKAIHEADSSWDVRVFVQVGSVSAAREAVNDGADVIVAQGVDAGGHQWTQGAGVISLVPEIRQLLRTEFPQHEVALVAAGGISHGSSVAAALALGAEAAVMGTRFLISEEVDTHPEAKKTILRATDGGSSTVKSYLHDDVRGGMEWPKLYDGRAVVGPSVEDDRAGVSLQDIIARAKKAEAEGDLSRKIYWSGTGVGLVNEVASVRDIVLKTREEALETIRSLQPQW